MEDLSPEGAAPAVALDLEPVDRINFALSQNGPAILRRVALTNEGDAPLEALEVTVTTRPAVMRPRSFRIDRIAPGATVVLPQAETPLDTAHLSGLNEAEWGEVVLQVHRGDELIAEAARPVEMLARDEWGGLSMAPLLAAHVSPNDAVVAVVLKDAARLLEAVGEPGDIDGYRSGDPGRPWMLAGAIWSALTAWGLSYALPPTSFELQGQKLRDPARIRSEGLATCLDSAVLLASCFEAAGLNPVILFAEGHAWAGFWLTDADFGCIAEPDVMTVRKAVDARELVMLETTHLTRRPAIAFEEAAAAGRDLVAERNEHGFLQALDIRRARAARIRPMASHRPPEDTDPDAPVAPAALPRPLPPGMMPASPIADDTPRNAADRIARWQRKLLDLSLRNRLLNFRDTRQTLPFVCPDIPALEDRLAQGQGIRPEAMAGDGLPEDAAILHQMANDAFARGRIAVPLAGKDMQERLLDLYRKARSDLQEGGTNTLFLAAGFLRWKNTAQDSRSYRAPLLLIPVRLTRRSAQSDFLIEAHEDDIRFNTTLLEFLKRDFDLKIPELEGDLPRDEAGFDVTRIFSTMRARIRDVPGFELVEEAALSTFSFAKFLMWKDLAERADSLRDSPLVRHLVDNPETPFLPDGDPGLAGPRDVDRRLPPQDLFAPLPADSSQLAAVLSAQEGRDFVLIGPPGTGKSQTIANIISQCLATGRTVLFVAEKSAALDVVHRRLNAHGLGDAVLELHSNKADRKAVMAQLGRSWDRASEGSDAEWTRVTADLDMTRQELNAYVAALHAKGRQGFSIFQAIGWSLNADPSLRLRFDNHDAHDEASFQRMLQIAATLGRTHRIVRDLPEFPLIGAQDWSFGWQATLLETAEALRVAARDLDAARQALIHEAGLQPDTGPDALADLARAASQGGDLGWAIDRDASALRAQAEDLARAIEARNAARGRLAGDYAPDAPIPVDRLDQDWRMARTRIWPMSALAMGRLRKLLQTYAQGGAVDPETDIPALAEIARHRAVIDASPLRDIADDPADLRRKADAAVVLLKAAVRIAPHVADQDRWHLALRRMAAGEDAAARALSVAEDTFRNAARPFAEAAGSDPLTMPLPRLLEQLETIDAAREHLPDWTRWNAARAQAMAAGLSPLVAVLEGGGIEQPLEDAFRNAYAAWWLPHALDADPVLRGFSHWAHEDAIARFRDLDRAATQMAAGQILSRIRHGLPARDAVPRKSELGTLRHQLGLQRPSMPIRSLIAQMPDAFTKLAPCVLMSPLSVAQYLPAGQTAFDVVIFDEASQITTWDAIGAIARGRQAIIVGDPKQLPPTNFFGKVEDDTDDIPETERDLPSILDEVAASGVPMQQLDWHYRSRDEALIAFSNWHYYGGRLITFPSPRTQSKAVRLHPVNGTYGRGKDRRNEVEARAITAMAVSRLTEWLTLPEADRPTLGVITFNAEQQALILDLLDEERRRDPELEWFFEDAREEPVIVKNLENIQGDERDVMLFSITFGPDQAGKLSMAFGALNGTGGEKRLNVAVTRARAELHVFASIRAEQIDLARTNATGVRHLKAFLDYAERGAVALPAQDTGSEGPVENPFEAAVMTALEARGWELRPQIGVSGFRIDLGVVHPDHAGIYLAGVECDGATYHGSATARDRDKVRQAVLEGLGWTILRVWSTDWFRHPRAVADRIHEALSEHLARDRACRAARKAETGAAPADAGGVTPDPERFFEAGYQPVLTRIIADILAEEAPIALDRLAARIATAHGWPRAGDRIQDRVRSAMEPAHLHREGRAEFLWPGERATRLPFREGTDRHADQIPLAEYATLLDGHPDADPQLLARLAGLPVDEGQDHLQSVIDWWRNSGA
ncbi:DUF3320 domain-containing protein [Paracoccus sp. C2R09]|nr:DUF3320 domain-containing protein [Paracoccus sp. C2R09]